jgi:uroporphyrinogen-III synthase
VKVLITRPRSQADDFAEKLSQAGFDPFFLPVIDIQPIENNLALQTALAKLDCYDWIVFTSVNAVEVVWNTWIDLGFEGFPESVRVAAIGVKTAQALSERQITPCFVPEEYVAEAILPGLGDLQSRWVLLPRADIARKALPEAISRAGGIAHDIAVYRTLPAETDPQAQSILSSDLDVITLTSPSTVQNFVAMARACGFEPQSLPGNPVFACIGPITEQAAEFEGLNNRIIAIEYTTEGLIEALKIYRTKQGSDHAH